MSEKRTLDGSEQESGGESGRRGSPAPDRPDLRDRRVYRLRDLDRRGRWLAAVFALALLLMPLIAFAQMAPNWAPHGDPALMALRALDVGTVRTPSLGQPSTSAEYVDGVPVVTHPGPLHFYLMALPVRLLGAAPGMLVVSLFITGGCILLAAWAAFRQLGPPGGVVAAVILGAITFTTGASSLMHPVSSSIAGYPVLCSMVLLWCLLSGDLRLLPLTAAVVSFAAQQHLSSVPTVIVAVALVGLVVVWREWRRWRGEDPASHRQLIRWVGWSFGIALVLWSPVLLQQFFGHEKNLSALVEFTRHDDRPTVGLDAALRQQAHILGIPPLLGKLRPTGNWLLSDVSVARGISAAAVLAVSVAVGLLARRSSWTRAAVALMTLILVAAGLFNGASVPVGLEMGRITFYHWAWPLTFFVLLGPGLAAVALLQRTDLAARRWFKPVALTLGTLAIAVPAVVNPTLDRRSNTLAAAGSPLEDKHIDELVDEILVHREALGEPTVVLERGRLRFEGFGHALTLELIERGVDVRMQPGLFKAVHRDRMISRRTVESGLLLVIGDGVSPYPREVPGDHVAEVIATDFDREAYLTLVEQLESADEVVLGDDLEQAIAELPRVLRELFRPVLADLSTNARDLLNKDLNVLRLLREHPLEQPRLDPALLDRLIESVANQESGWELDVYLLDREEVLEHGNDYELGR